MLPIAKPMQEGPALFGDDEVPVSPVRRARGSTLSGRRVSRPLQITRHTGESSRTSEQGPRVRTDDRSTSPGLLLFRRRYVSLFGL